MKLFNAIGYTLKYCFWGLLLGFLILFFMPESKLVFNWQSAQKAWQFYQINSEQMVNRNNNLLIEDISFSRAVDIASPSVVSVNVYRRKGLRDSEKLAADEKILDVSVGIGSGVILSARGFIVTNYHVIENADKVSINLIDGRRRFVEVVGFDKNTDIAVLKTDIQGLQPANLALDSEVKTGDLAMAIGNPFSFDQQSVSLGIISAVSFNPLRIQTDAAINTGNSGGALINLHGQVIGINQGRLPSPGGGQTGLNYAIPVFQAKQIAEDIILYGHVRSNWLGIEAAQYTPSEHKKQFPTIPFGSGFFVRGVVPNSPADLAGLQLGDFITRFEDQRISGVASFYKLFYAIPLGKKVTVELIREGELKSLTIVLFEKKPES